MFRELGVKSNRCHRYKVLPGIKYFPVPTHPPPPPPPLPNNYFPSTYLLVNKYSLQEIITPLEIV